MKFSPIEELLRERIGFDAQSLGPAALPRAIRDRMQVRQVADVGDYTRTLTAEAVEWSALLTHLLVSESWFFRGGRPLFDYLAGWVRDRASSRPVRILSVPCSTGEEPYSLAIALRETGVPSSHFHIDAVDLSPDHLHRASAGVFNAFAFRDATSDPREFAFLHRSDDRWELLPRYRESVHFRPGNAIERNFLGDEAPYDLILSRNLFIYLTPDGCNRAMVNLDRLLAPDGQLCLTPAEADRLPSARFELDGPVAFALYRRTHATSSGVVPLASRSGTTTVAPPRSAVKAPTTPLAPPPPRIEIAKPSTRVVNPFEIARSLADAGQLDEARAACERLLESLPTADGFALLGVIHLAAGRHTDASGAFRKALYLDPDHAEALTHMIVLHEQRGEAEPAAALNRRLARVRRREPA